MSDGDVILYPTLPLAHIARIERGKFSARPRNDPQFYGGDIPFLQTGDIARAGRNIKNWTQTLNEKGLKVSRLFPRGTIFMSIAANIGDVAISMFDAACPDSVVAVTPKQGVDSEWLFQTLKFSKVGLSALSTQNAQANLSLEKIEPFKVHFVAQPEQRKIAEILHTWDEAIERATLVIELRQAQYLGLRNQLINWSSDPQKSLQSLLEPVSRPVPRPTESYRALSIRSHGKGTFIRNVADPTSVDMDTLYIAREGDLIVNITFAWEGAIALIPQEHDGCLVSHRFPTFVPISRRVSARYLRHALRMAQFTYLLGLVSPGGAGRNRVLNKRDFLDLEVPAPELDKQALIASALDTAETAIAKASEYRDSLAHQKRGLMQKLLTGEWRVQVEVAA